ncbi:ABC transporter ATP-binding protein [Finegoldia magna]|uniref:ABC transporter ATP-binding protein n=1 Tax=Finegoldia magna TaxID=1260 RepID=UPI000B91ADDF|nr:ABC transporter ATP-binding protein [Finegoldia magna]MBS6928307.1 ABC transporter ATP-binding protein [Finegoldia magna]MDU1213227.1 ABC transporter ATP-binding protein [Finegoldia magna]MDU4730849.1 ABC transporter ATP-binding protein [Finegoldia magna]MDU7033328.1 ABC transporter ATP-binding protein [Finegoldia magna]OXZ41567.1 thiamine ABC transporter permease [Finegoldia magna]
MKRNLNLIKRVMPYFKKYKFILMFDLFCAALTTLTDMVLPMILRRLTNAGLGTYTLTREMIFRMAGLLLIMKIIDLFAGFYMTKTGHIMGAKIETDMRYDVFQHLQKLSDSYFNETKVGQIMARITSDLFDITEFSHHCPEEYFIGLIKIIVSFAILVRLNTLLTVILFLSIPLMIVFASKYNRRMRKGFKEQKRHIGVLNADIEDSLLGVKVVKSFANEDVEIEKFQKGNKKFLDIKSETYSSMAGFNTITKAFDGIMYIIVVLFGGLFLVEGKMSSGDIVAFILYVQTLLTTVRRIVEFTEQFQRGMTGIERFTEIMDQDIEIFDDEDAVDLENVKGKIEIKNVSFKYNNNNENVLNNISFTINPGQKVALVGPSGGGKTTLCNLIPRFYDVEDGEILVEGIDVRKIKLQSLRSNIGMVQQDVYLFSGTVRENILYGKPDATEQEIIDASKAAGAYDFIMNLENGFDTYVGERGVMLSGGQKQRISIARVFLKNPPILILDEATSALDNKSEFIVQESLENLAKGRSSLTIAHRLTTVQNADLILVLTEEGIIERGTHQELMEQKGYYYNLYTQGGRLLV